MFTWVCPTCGKEWDVGTRQCPDCAGRVAAAGASRGRSMTRFWLLLALGAIVGVAALVALARYQSRKPPSTVTLEAPVGSKPLPPPEPIPEPAAAVRDLPPPQPPPPPPPSAPEWARHVEIAGVRTYYDPQNKPRVRVVIVNHGEDGLRDTVFTVALRPAQSAAASPPLARFKIKIAAEIKPNASREIEAPLDAMGTLAALPPWRQLRADLE